MSFRSNVAGGTKGIGRVIVEHFLTEGANVSYASRSVRGDEFVNFKGVTNNARAVGTKLDINNLADIENWIKDAANEFGRIDTVIGNGKGTYLGIKSWSNSSVIAVTAALEPTTANWEKSLTGDLLGLRTLILAATPYLEKCAATGGNPSIVVISSLAGFENKFPVIGSAYTTVKRAQAIMAKDLSRELGPKKIRINTITPGYILTDNLTLPDGTTELSTVRALKEQDPTFFDELEKQTPLGRPGNSADVAHGAVFLASPLAGYITGATLHIDGGSSQAF